MFDEDAILQIRRSCDYDGGRGGVDDENCRQKKIEDYKVSRLFFDVYRHLAQLDDKADRPRSTR